MKKIKFLGLSLMCLIAVMLLNSAAYASNIGVVDLSKVIESYSKAQEVSADLKIKETELQKFIEDAQKKIEKAKTPVEKKNLEDRLGEQFNIKRNVFAKEQADKWQQIEDKVLKKITEVSKKQKMDIVLNQQSVIIGGKDITDEIIKQLNKETKKR